MQRPRRNARTSSSVSERSRGDNARKLSSWKTLCGVSLFCAAVAIVSPAQTLMTLASFNLTNGATPAAALAQGTDGNFYGTTEEGGAHSQGTVFKITPRSMTVWRCISVRYGCTTLKLANCPAGLPVILESSTQLTTTQGDDCVSTAHGPEHSRPFQPSQYGFTPCLDDSRAHE